MRIIPAIDIIDGKCVRLTQGDYTQQKTYNAPPLEVAKEFEDYGIEYLHLVDLDGAKSGQIINYKVLETIATKTNLKIDFGGGLKREEDVKIAFSSGAHQITGGSIAVKNPTLFEHWLKKYGCEKIILGADVKEEKIAINGWLETSDKNLLPFLKEYHKKGVAYVICTDIAKDGVLQGASFDLYQKIILEIPKINLISSGGITTTEDLYKLKDLGCEGAIIGKAIYEGYIRLKDLEGFLK